MDENIGKSFGEHKRLLCLIFFFLDQTSVVNVDLVTRTMMAEEEFKKPNSIVVIQEAARSGKSQKLLELKIKAKRIYPDHFSLLMKSDSVQLADRSLTSVPRLFIESFVESVDMENYQKCLVSNKLIIFFDDFDAIPQKRVKDIVNVIILLFKKKNLIFLTSRTPLKHFESMKLFKFVPFTEDEQILLLTNEWRKNHTWPNRVSAETLERLLIFCFDLFNHVMYKNNCNFFSELHNILFFAKQEVFDSAEVCDDFRPCKIKTTERFLKIMELF